MWTQLQYEIQSVDQHSLLTLVGTVVWVTSALSQAQLVRKETRLYFWWFYVLFLGFENIIMCLKAHWVTFKLIYWFEIELIKCIFMI